MKLKTGDTVYIKSGKDRGRRGKVLKTLPEKGKVVVEGMNVRKKHVRARRQGEKGQVVQFPAPFDASNVMVFCSKCSKGVRVGFTVQADKKQRVCRKCNSPV